jgi:hypothetical protein
VPRFVSETAVEIHYSRQSHYRAIITTDSNGLYRVRREFWDAGDWEVAGVAFWNQNDRFATITDTLEIARNLVCESLAETPDGIEATD